jgi:uracil-DNA glycosylase
VGMANQAMSVRRGDGLELKGVYIGAAVRCAPPGNKPEMGEIERCRGYLDREWELLKDVRVMLALGRIGWDAALALAVRHGCELGEGKKAFGHGVEMKLGGESEKWLVGSYHVSQQNTFTGKLTETMFDRVLGRARELAGG